jgi:hypothetical protein
MSKQILYTGIALIAVGVAGYAASGAASATALIPAVFGIVFAGLGLAGRRESFRRHAMHGALIVALLALGGTFGGLVELAAWIGGTAPARPLATVARTITALLCLALLAGGIRSFIAARQNG